MKTSEKPAVEAVRSFFGRRGIGFAVEKLEGKMARGQIGFDPSATGQDFLDFLF